MNKRSAFLFIALLVGILYGCSTESNTFLSRSYHSTTARYNGLFNANELMRVALKTYYDSRKEDFYSILPINPLPNETESKGMYPSIDTAISKCTKVILNHSMPTAENMYAKNAEYNNWIDENWLAVGRALYYRRDYEKAMKNFLFVKRFFVKVPSMYEAELWIAKINIETNKFADAKLKLDELNEISLTQKKRKFVEYIPFYKPKPKEGEEEAKPRMSKNLQFDIYKAYADLAVRRRDYPAAIEGLNLAVVKCKNAKEKARMHYILGQLYQQMNDTDSAAIHYNLANKPSANFDIAFNARLNRAMTGSSDKLGKDLKRMLRDSKNAPFKDQIYYAMASYELNRLNKPKAKEYLTQSVFYSNGNKRQKAMSYQKLGDLNYNDKNYVAAQKYYDSCSRFIDDTYPNGDEVKNKAIKLADLVKAIETATFEDSVQRIAKMSERDRNDYLKDVLKQIKEEEQKRKEAEAAKLLALQTQANNNSKSDSKFVFNNPKMRDDGYNEFRKLWGTRENEDDWRRSEKIVNPNATKEGTKGQDSTTTASKDKEDTLNVASLLKNIPLTPEALEESRERLMDALYTSGVLYKEILNESELAAEQFEAVLKLKKECLTDLSSAFQLYKLNEGSAQQNIYKEYIIDHYPQSDAAKYFKDPDFYVKQKQNQKAAETEYLTLLEKYNQREYSKVLNATQAVLDKDKSNAYRAEYLLLNVLAAGQLTQNKQDLVPKLNNIIAEKPGTPQAARAQEMLNIIKNGYSQNSAANFEKNYIFKFDNKGSQYVIVLLDETDDAEDAKNVITDFSSKKYKATRTKVSLKTTTTEKNFMLITEFTSISAAQDYINAYKAGTEFLDDYQNNKIFIINQENLKKLIETSKFDEYRLFYDDFY